MILDRNIPLLSALAASAVALTACSEGTPPEEAAAVDASAATAAPQAQPTETVGPLPPAEPAIPPPTDVPTALAAVEAYAGAIGDRSADTPPAVNANFGRALAVLFQTEQGRADFAELVGTLRTIAYDGGGHIALAVDTEVIQTDPEDEDVELTAEYDRVRLVTLGQFPAESGWTFVEPDTQAGAGSDEFTYVDRLRVRSMAFAGGVLQVTVARDDGDGISLDLILPPGNDENTAGSTFVLDITSGRWFRQ
ncbi:MAG: hypothetical protein AAFR38_01700 [Planctomycetota bacterium]